MNKFLTLILFELKKIFNRKKIILFLTALNIVPVIASIIFLIVYIRFRSFGFAEVQFKIMLETIQTLFSTHIYFFTMIMPFFLALIVGDSFSSEFGKGHMKMLLLTPVTRWEVITAKTAVVMIFLIVAVSIGGAFLQLDLVIARAFTEKTVLQSETAQETGIYLIGTKAAFQLLAMMFVSNLMLIGFFVLFSLFFESPIVMSFASLIVLMAIHTYHLIASNILNRLEQLDNWHVSTAKWCFTRHISDVFSYEIIQKIISGEITITSNDISPSLYAAFGWSIFFFLLATVIFSRKKILH